MFDSVFKSLVTRRSLLKGSLAMASAPMISIGNETRQTEQLLDFSNPFDNLYAFGKLWGSYDSKPIYSAYKGVQFARIGTKRLIPLFGYTGFGNMQSRLNDDQTINIRGTEGGYFTNLTNGEIIDHWDNPWTGETVEVFPFINK
ncbi:MAG TPA: DUF1838 family protein, partial [Gammaproteobacteria bacterium]|nr:DUF1838 family protein [Gammaproteobacteria bacterium]